MAESEQPLLLGHNQSRKVYPSCPGCKVAKLIVEGGPPPYKKLFLAAVIVFCNALPTSSLFPFVYVMVQPRNAMVREFQIAKREEDIGFYAGCVGSAFMFGRFLTSFQWGMVADKYGRKPVILVGLISMVFFNTLFGVSTNFWMAVLSRLLLGIFNGSFGATKAYASEVCSDSHQALSVSIVGTTWGLGLIIGPAIGGYFARPAETYPNLFPVGSLFDRFPYLLPSLVVSSIAVVGIVITLQLPETLHVHDVEESLPVAVADVEKNNIPVSYEEGGPTAGFAEQEGIKKTSPLALLKHWPLQAAIFLFCLWALFDVAYTEIFSFWCLSPRANGGLDFTTSDVGNVLAASGFGMLVCQLFVFPPLTTSVGPTTVIRVAIVLILPLLATFPLIAKLDGITLWVCILFASVSKNILSATIIDGGFLLVNNAVKPSQRGAANGLAVSLMSISTTIAPEAGGALFAWAQSRHSNFLPGDSFVFFILGLACLVAGCWTWQPGWPRSLDFTKHEHDDDDS